MVPVSSAEPGVTSFLDGSMKVLTRLELPTNTEKSAGTKLPKYNF